MKIIKKLFSVMIICVIILSAFPTAFLVLGSSEKTINLTTLKDFSDNSSYSVKTENGNGTTAVTSFVSNSKIIGNGISLKVDMHSLASWNKYFLDIPLNAAVGNAAGILLYTDWVDNTNFYVSLTAVTANGASVTATPGQNDSAYPLYNISDDKWSASEWTNNFNVGVRKNFKGYIYLPFDRFFGDTKITDITNIQIGSWRTESVTSYTIGGLWLVTNDIIPSTYMGETVTNLVLIDNAVEASLSQKIALASQIELTTIDDFTGNKTYSVTDANGKASSAVAKAVINESTIGEGNALKIDMTSIGSWNKAFVTVPCNISTDNAKGILLYTEWVDNLNFYLKLTAAIGNGSSITKGFSIGDSAYPLYNPITDTWSGSGSTNNGSIDVGSTGFKGYIYIPFERIFGDTKLTAVTDIQIGSFKTGTSAGKAFIIGGLWSVTNVSIPTSYNKDTVTNKVLLDGSIETSLKIIDTELTISGYKEQLSGVLIDEFFHTQADMEKIVNKLDQLEIDLNNAATQNEKRRLAEAFDVDFKAFIDGPVADFEFAAISDLHLRAKGSENTNRFRRFLNDVKTALPNSQAVIVAGDLTENGSEEDYKLYWNTITKSAPDGNVVLSAMGNHDARGNFLGSDSKAARWKLAKERYLNGLNKYLSTDYTDTYYHYTVNGYDFLVLNTEDADKDAATVSIGQQEWLKAKLAEISAAKPDNPIFVMLHQPLVNTHPGTDVSTSTAGVSSKALKSIISEYPQVVYFSGHLHNGIGHSDIINDGKGIYVDLPSIEKNSVGNSSLTLAYYVSIYDNIIRFRVRDFSTGEWLSEKETVMPLSGVSAVNKDDLRKAYYLYRYTGKGRYTEKSWANFTAALEKAHTVLNNLTATQAEIDAAYKSLMLALDALETAPLDLAANKSAMTLEILQDFDSFDTKNVVSGSSYASAKLSDTVLGIDSSGSLVLGSSHAADSNATYTIAYKDGSDLSKAEGILVYLKLPRGKLSKLSIDTVLGFAGSSGNLPLSNGEITYLDNTSQSWTKLSVSSDGTAHMPTGFEGYVRILFKDLNGNLADFIKASSAMTVSCANIGSDLTAVVGGIYSVTHDTAGITAIVDGRPERYILNGKTPTKDNKELFANAMKAETLQSFKGYTVGENAVGDFVTVENYIKNDFDITVKKGISRILPGNSLSIDADSAHSFWSGDNTTVEWSYIKMYYPENTYIDRMMAFMFYIDTSGYNPTSEDPFNTKIFFNLHTIGSDGSSTWSNTGSYETLYFLEEGTNKWRRIESDSGHAYIPIATKGYILAPIDSFVSGEIAALLDGRRIVDTTFIVSGFGGEIGPAVIGGVWSVMDYGSNNMLMSYDGAHVWNLSHGTPATAADINSGSEFPEEDVLLGELPEATTNKYQINDPDWNDISDSSVKLSWDVCPGACTYKVQIFKTVYSGTGIKYKLVSEKTTKDTTALLDGLEPVCWYYVVVHAYDSGGDLTAIYPNTLFQTAHADDDTQNTVIGTTDNTKNDNTFTDNVETKTENAVPDGTDNTKNVTYITKTKTTVKPGSDFYYYLALYSLIGVFVLAALAIPLTAFLIIRKRKKRKAATEEPASKEAVS